MGVFHVDFLEFYSYRLSCSFLFGCLKVKLYFKQMICRHPIIRTFIRRPFASAAIVTFLTILTVSCKYIYHGGCARMYMNHQKFLFIPDKGPSTSYFIIDDSVHREYDRQGIFAESLIKWRSCNNYILIMKQFHRSGEMYKIGDTLSVDVRSISGDTLNCTASWHNVSFPLRYVKSHWSNALASSRLGAAQRLGIVEHF